MEFNWKNILGWFILIISFLILGGLVFLMVNAFLSNNISHKVEDIHTCVIMNRTGTTSNCFCGSFERYRGYRHYITEYEFYGNITNETKCLTRYGQPEEITEYPSFKGWTEGEQVWFIYLKLIGKFDEYRDELRYYHLEEEE